MQERARVSSMDLKAHMNNLRKNPKFTEEILKLVESDLQYGLTIEETEMYTSKRFDYAQMKVYSACLRNGYPEDVRECITRDGLTGEQMAVALEFYEKGVPLKTVAEVTENSSHTAFMMKKLFQSIVSKVQAAGEAVQAQDDYAKDLLEQIKSVVEKIEFQEKRYDALNEKLKELQTAGQDAKIQNNLLNQLAEKDSMLEKQQDELNEARGTIARLRNEMDAIRKERDRLEKRTEEMEKEAATKGSNTVTKPEVAVADKKEEAKSMVQAEVKQEVPVIPSFPGVGYNVAVLDGNGKVVSFMPVERMERKRERSTMSAIFSRLAFKKKIDIVKLVAEKDLEPKQLVQIRSAIEKGLSEDQLLVLINNQIPAEQMEEIINIAVYENKQKQEV
jgi:DNA repair exonuclease SbcCD ATPase subunit